MKNRAGAAAKMAGSAATKAAAAAAAAGSAGEPVMSTRSLPGVKITSLEGAHTVCSACGSWQCRQSGCHCHRRRLRAERQKEEIRQEIRQEFRQPEKRWRLRLRSWHCAEMPGADGCHKRAWRRCATAASRSSTSLLLAHSCCFTDQTCRGHSRGCGGGRLVEGAGGGSGRGGEPTVKDREGLPGWVSALDDDGKQNFKSFFENFEWEAEL